MEFAPFEIAKKLKEKGFPQRPDYFNYSSYYEWDGLRKTHSLYNASVWFDPNVSRDNIYYAPTISQVLEWLRKEKKIYLVIEVIPLFAAIHKVGFYYKLYLNSNGEQIDCRESEESYMTFESASLEGIKDVLDYYI